MRYILSAIIFFTLSVYLIMNATNITSDNHSDNASTCVILLHGLGRSSSSMKKIADELTKNNYIVWNESYPSREYTVQQLTKIAIDPALTYCRNHHVKNIHFVTHSLGGILVRYYLQDNQIENLGRIVMLSPPNMGSEVVDEFKDFKFFQLVMGPAGQQLGTDISSIPNQLDPINGEIGIIIGNSTSDPWFSWFIPGEDDGKVSVERAKLKEMKEFLVVDHGHSFIMSKKDVIDQVLAFIKHGQFIQNHDKDNKLEELNDR